MKRLAALTISLALVAHPTPAHAHDGLKAQVARHWWEQRYGPPARCYRGELSGVNEVRSCWLALIKTCPVWEPNRMAVIVWRESRGWPKADNPSSTAFGLYQRLRETSVDPKVQTRNACALARNADRARKGKGHWSDPWRATR